MGAKDPPASFGRAVVLYISADEMLPQGDGIASASAQRDYSRDHTRVFLVTVWVDNSSGLAWSGGVRGPAASRVEDPRSRYELAIFDFAGDRD